jgi:hypothetical protein
VVNGQRLKVLRAVVERVIPADDVAGGVTAGVDNFIVRLLDGDSRKDMERVAAGLDELDAQGFCGMDAAAQDAVLRQLENQRWFERLVEMAMEGFYGDPGNGGNKEEVAWRMIGYDPGRARK